MSRHYKILEVAPEIVAGLCRGTYHVCANEIPDRTAVVSRSYDAHTDRFRLILEHESFPALAPNDPIPCLDSPYLERIEVEDKLRQLAAVAKAAVELFDEEYSELTGQVVIPLSGEQKAKLRKLADRLHDAGYEWMELT